MKKAHYDPLIKTMVRHDHDPQDIIGLADIIKGFQGALDAHTGTLENPMSAPVATTSGWWLITVVGYISVGGASTAFEIGDMLVYSENTGLYSRIDARWLDAQLGITSTFTSSTLVGKLTQKEVNDALDAYMASVESIAIGVLESSVGYLFNGTSSHLSIPSNVNFDYLGMPFTYEMVVKLPDLFQSAQTLIFQNAGGYCVYFTTNNMLAFGLYGSNWGMVPIDNYLGKVIHLVLGWIGFNAFVYINGISIVDTYQESNIVNTSEPILIGGHDEDGFFSGEIYLFRLYNKGLTSLEVLAHFNNGNPCSYVMSYLDSGGSNSPLTEGTLKIGKKYRIKTYVEGDNFENIGALSGASGMEFVATGTIPASWTYGSELIQLGNVLDLQPKYAGHLNWRDCSGNELHAFNAESLLINEPDEEFFTTGFFKSDISETGKDVVIPDGYILSSCFVDAQTMTDVTAFTALWGTVTMIDPAVIPYSHVTKLHVNDTFILQEASPITFTGAGALSEVGICISGFFKKFFRKIK